MLSAHRELLFWIAVALCAVAQLGILRPLVAPRRSAPAPRPGVPTGRRATEVLWTVVPAIGLAALLVFTWRAIHASPPASGGQGGAGARSAALATGAGGAP